MNDVHSYVRQFFSLNNPLIYSLIFSVIIVALVMWIFFKIIFPMRMKFYKEKQDILLEQARLMALFSELDPDPLLRINPGGQIIQTNEASRLIFGDIDFKKTGIEKLLSGIKHMHDDFISRDIEFSFVEKINNKVFAVNVRGNHTFGFANIYLHDITRIKEYESELEEYKDKLKTLAERLESKFESEKKSISSELHDDIGQRLVLLKLKLSQLNNEGGDIYKDLEEIYARVRELSHLLKPAEIDELGLRFAIQNLVNKITADSNLEGTFTFLGKEEKLHPEIELCILRVVQEALSNILKHAGAKEFSVQLIFEKNNINLIITDDGKGIPVEYFESRDLKNFGIGIFNMNERVENFNGTMKINSASGEGTSIIINIPKLARHNEFNTVAGS